MWARYSEVAHAWFARISPLIHVIEDQPPHEPAWADPHPDPNDAWLWNAARRARADFLVTMNLKDAPPADPVGVRQHERIMYIHPNVFVSVLDIWSEILETGAFPDDFDGQLRGVARPGRTRDAQAVTVYLQTVLARIADENAAEQG